MLCYTEYSSGEMNSRKSYCCSFAAGLNAIENSLELQKGSVSLLFFLRVGVGAGDGGTVGQFNEKKRCFLARF
jgi:hypothetical protein